MKQPMELQYMNVTALSEEELMTSGGVVPVALAIAGIVVGIYGGLLAIGYYTGYAAHAVVDMVSSK